MLRKVYLEGILGEKYGKELEIEANSFSDVFNCLKANFEDFQEWFLNNFGPEEDKLKISCIINNYELESDKELTLLYNEGDMIISPIPAGSKGAGKKLKKAFKIIVGVALIVGGGYMLAGGTLFGVGGALAGNILVALGTSLLVSGIQDLMAPDPQKDLKNDNGYVYQGSSQNIAETDPVPIVYGRIRIPGRPISFEIRNAETVITNFQ
jgi:predicted phage tail protein